MLQVIQQHCVIHTKDSMNLFKIHALHNLIPDHSSYTLEERWSTFCELRRTGESYKSSEWSNKN